MFAFNNKIYAKPCFFNVTFLEEVKVISSFGFSDGFVESVSEYYIVVSVIISRIMSKD